MKPEIKKWNEFDDQEKTEYVIEAYFDDESIYELRFYRYYYPLHPHADNYVANVWEIVAQGTELGVTKKVIRNSWNGTGTEVHGSIYFVEPAVDEAWFFDPEELENTILKHGVKRTIEFIIEGFAEATSAFFTPPWKEDC